MNKEVWKVIKLDNKWVIYNTENGRMVTSLFNKQTKNEALKWCELYNKQERKNVKK